MKKRIFSIIAALALCLGLATASALAAGDGDYSISLDPASLDFGVWQLGRERPAAQTVTLTNTSSQPLRVSVPGYPDYAISYGTGFDQYGIVESLAPSDSVKFTLRPAENLSIGSYSTGGMGINYKGPDEQYGTLAFLPLSLDVVCTEHEYGEWTITSDTHSGVCQYCKAEETGSHTFESGTCAICGAAEPARAAVNGVEYGTLAGAWAAAKEAGSATVTLLADAEISQALTVEDGDDITLDCGIYTLTSTADRIVEVSGGSFTLADGTIKLYNGTSGTAKCYGVYVSSGSFALKDGMIELRSEMTGAVDGYGVCVSGGSATIKGGAIRAINESTNSNRKIFMGVQVKDTGIVTIDDGTITADGGSNRYNHTGIGVEIYNNGIAFINGGTISGNGGSLGIGVRARNGNKTKVTITDGIFTGTSSNTSAGLHMGSSSGVKIELSGGRFTGETAAVRSFTKSVFTLLADGSFYYKEEADGTKVHVDKAVEIYDSGWYYNLKDATYLVGACIHEAESWTDANDGQNHSGACKWCGETVTEAHQYNAEGKCTACGAAKPVNVASVTVDGEVTNYTDIAEAFEYASGKTATITLLADIGLKQANNDEALLVNNAASKITLELNGKTLDYYADRNTIEGIIIISDGSLTIQDSSDPSSGLINKGNGDGIKLTGGSLTLESGTVKANNFAIRVQNGATLAVNGGTVDGNTGIYGYGGVIAINGGVVSARGSSGFGVNVASGSSMTVTGGYIKSEKHHCLYNTYSLISISGGFISSASGKLDILVGTSPSVSVSGGWFSKQVDEGYCAEGYEPTTTSVPVADSPVADAVWYTVKELPAYKVTFETGGGSAVDSQTVYQGKTAQEPSAPTRTGFTFDGWYTDADSTAPYDFTAPVMGDLILRAKWTEIRYTVTVEVSGHGTASASPAEAAAGTPVTLTAAADSGYRLKEWQTVSGGAVISGSSFTMPAENVTVRAVFEAVPDSSSQSGGGSSTYAVTVEDAAHGSVKADRTRAAVGTTVTLTVTPKDGYQLDGLTVTDSKGSELKLTDKGNGKFTFRMPSGRVTVEAVFTAIETGHDCPSLDFTDLSAGAWYHEAVDYVLENGLMDGYGSGVFGPGHSLSRAMVAQILYNQEGKPAAGQSTFDDVADSAWYAGAVTWANADGIVSGYGDGRFGPDDPITREQLAVILYHYAQFKGMETVTLAENLIQFADAGKISGYAVQAMNWAVGQGIMAGYDGRLNPQGNATRAEAAQMLMNLLESMD